MHYVYLENNIVVDQAQIDPYKVFYPEYASKFIEAPDEVTHFWQLKDGQWVPPPDPSVDEIKEQNKTKASEFLQATDWAAIPTITDPQYSNPYLTNQSDFLNYRNKLRAIAINPPETLVETWPTKPTTVWSK